MESDEVMTASDFKFFTVLVCQCHSNRLRWQSFLAYQFSCMRPAACIFCNNSDHHHHHYHLLSLIIVSDWLMWCHFRHQSQVADELPRWPEESYAVDKQLWPSLHNYLWNQWPVSQKAVGFKWLPALTNIFYIQQELYSYNQAFYTHLPSWVHFYPVSIFILCICLVDLPHPTNQNTGYKFRCELSQWIASSQLPFVPEAEWLLRYLWMWVPVRTIADWVEQLWVWRFVGMNHPLWWQIRLFLSS